MKKIAIFSDIHGNLEALESILKDIDEKNIDEIICLGDIIGFGPSPKECLDRIIHSRVKMVKGNHEIYQFNTSYNNLTDNELKHVEWIKRELSEEELNYIENIPMTIQELINGKLYIFSHFFFNEERTYFQSLNILSDNRIYDTIKELETDYMFIGHSHDAFQINNQGLYTCVGSSGCTKNNITFYTLLEIEDKNTKITKIMLEYDRKTFEKKLKNSDYPDVDKIKEERFGVRS